MQMASSWISLAIPFGYRGITNIPIIIIMDTIMDIMAVVYRYR